MSQKKKTKHTTASWQHCQATFPNGTLERGEAQSPPVLFPSYPPSSFLKTRNHIVKCCFVFYHSFRRSFRLQLQSFIQSIQHPWRKKFVQRENLYWMKKLTFVLHRMQTQTKSRYFGKRFFFFFTLENSSRGKNAIMSWHEWHAQINRCWSWYYSFSFATKIWK